MSNNPKKRTFLGRRFCAVEFPNGFPVREQFATHEFRRESDQIETKMTRLNGWYTNHPADCTVPTLQRCTDDAPQLRVAHISHV